MLQRPLLSIAVPTKNRYKYLKKFIILFNEVYKSSDIELAISDNSDDNKDFLMFLKKIDDKRIKYTYSNEPLSVCDNADKAILLSTGEYVNMIGDDDANQREIIDVTRYMKECNIDSLNCYRCQYRWPGLKAKYFNNAGTLKIKKTTRKITRVNIEHELIKILKEGACATYGKLPCVYNGIVKRDILDLIYNNTGTFFPGPSPDMSNAIALSLVVNQHVYLDYPISWAGKSPSSAGGLGAMHKHALPISDVPWLPKDAMNTWEKKLPQFWTVSSVWAESAIKSLRKMGREDLIMKYFSYEGVYGRYLAFSFSDRKYIRDLLKHSSIYRVVYFGLMAWIERIRIAPKNIILTKIGKFGKTKMIRGINDIIECEEFISRTYPYINK